MHLSEVDNCIQAPKGFCYHCSKPIYLRSSSNGTSADNPQQVRASIVFRGLQVTESGLHFLFASLYTPTPTFCLTYAPNICATLPLSYVGTICRYSHDYICATLPLSYVGTICRYSHDYICATLPLSYVGTICRYSHDYICATLLLSYVGTICRYSHDYIWSS